MIETAASSSLGLLNHRFYLFCFAEVQMMKKHDTMMRGVTIFTCLNAISQMHVREGTALQHSLEIPSISTYVLTILFCILSLCTLLCCTILLYSVLYLYDFILNYSPFISLFFSSLLFCTVLSFTKLYRTMPHYFIMYCSITFNSILVSAHQMGEGSHS